MGSGKGRIKRAQTRAAKKRFTVKPPFPADPKARHVFAVYDSEENKNIATFSVLMHGDKAKEKARECCDKYNEQVRTFMQVTAEELADQIGDLPKLTF